VPTATKAFSHSRLDRLTKPAEFGRVFEKALRTNDRFFTILWRDNERSRSRIGFAIAKKRLPLAVARNRVRRLARENFRHHKHEVGSVDIVVLAQKAAGEASNAELCKSLEKHWRKIESASSAQGRNTR